MAPTAMAASRIALVIGNASYADKPLSHPKRDADDMAALLRGLGFEVTEATDLNLEEIEQRVRAFVDAGQTASVRLFYYSGHGANYRNGNYLLPIGHHVQRAYEMKYRAYPLEALLEGLRASAAPGGVNIVLVDACRDAPFGEENKSIGDEYKGLGRVDPVAGTLIAYAAGAGERALGQASERNSLFTKHLLQHLKDPVPLVVALTDVTGAVQRENDRQLPEIRSQLTRSFYLMEPATVASESLPATPPPGVGAVDPKALELSYWESIKASRDPVDYRDFLARFPTGTFASLAQRKLRELEPPLAQPTPPGETDDKTQTGSGGNRKRRLEPSSDRPTPPGETDDKVGRGWLGVTIQEMTPELARSFKLDKPHGALVAQVQPAGPAQAAGIQSDDIVVAINDQPINQPDELPPLVQRIRPGTSVPLTLIREGKEKTLTVRIGEFKFEKVAGYVFSDKLKDGNDGPAMVVIPAGEFWMGSPEGKTGRQPFEPNERRHRVEIGKAFALGQHEVTVGEFRRFVEATDYRTDADRNVGEKGCFALSEKGPGWQAGASWRKPGYEQDDAHPAACISGNDAMAYAEWLTKETGQAYRLPTEAEWEYAARAGTTSARYWGDDPDQACRYANVLDRTVVKDRSDMIHDCVDGHDYPAPVGSFQPNGWNLYDMLGNVWEWTCSLYDKDYGGAEAKCAEKDTTSPLAVRGGGWNDKPARVRSAYRNGAAPADRFGNQGFRLARSL